MNFEQLYAPSLKELFVQQLQEMICLKERYTDLLVIEGTENLRDIIADQHFDDAEQILLYELFEYS